MSDRARTTTSASNHRDWIAVRTLLDELLRRERLYAILATLVGLIAAFLLWLLVMLIVDAQVELAPGSRRAALLTSIWIGSGGVLLLGGWILLRRHSLLSAAQRVERHTSFSESLITCVELHERSGISEDERQALPHIDRRAAELLMRINLDEVVSPRLLLRILALLGAVVLSLTVYGLWHHDTFGARIGRLLSPRQHRRPATATTIWKVEPGDAHPLRGEPLAFRAYLLGTRPDEVVLEYWRDDAREYAVPMTHQGDEVYGCDLPALRDSLQYRIRAGDDVTRTYRLDVVDQPVVAGLQARVVPPDHVEAEVEEFTTGNLRVIPGSRVELEARTNVQPAESPTLLLGAMRRRMETVQPNLLRAEFVVQEPIEYEIHFEDEYGHGNDDRLIYRIDVLGDSPPTTAIVDPAADVELAADASLPVTIAARDDLGLDSLELHIEPSRGAARSRRLPLQPSRLDSKAQVRIKPAALGLQPGDTLTYFATCADCRRPQKQRAESNRYTIRISEPKTAEAPARSEAPSLRDNMRELKEQLDEALDSLAEAQDEERRLSSRERDELADRLDAAAEAAERAADPSERSGDTGTSTESDGEEGVADAADGEGSNSGRSEPSGSAASDGSEPPPAEGSAGAKESDGDRAGESDASAGADSKPSGSTTAGRNGESGEGESSGTEPESTGGDPGDEDTTGGAGRSEPSDGTSPTDAAENGETSDSDTPSGSAGAGASGEASGDSSLGEGGTGAGTSSDASGDAAGRGSLGAGKGAKPGPIGATEPGGEDISDSAAGERPGADGDSSGVAGAGDVAGAGSGSPGESKPDEQSLEDVTQRLRGLAEDIRKGRRSSMQEDELKALRDAIRERLRNEAIDTGIAPPDWAEDLPLEIVPLTEADPTRPPGHGDGPATVRDGGMTRAEAQRLIDSWRGRLDPQYQPLLQHYFRALADRAAQDAEGAEEDAEP